MDKVKYKELKAELKHLSKDQILDAFEYLRSLELVKSEVNLEDTLMSGQLDDSTFLFRDEEEGFIIVRDGEIKKWDSATVKSHLMQRFMITNGSFVANRMNFIPIFSKVFDPKQTDRIYQKGKVKYFNTFFPTKYIEKTKNVKKRHAIDIDYIKNNYKLVYLLLWNLFREDKHIKYFINWFSAALNKREKLGVSIALKGVQGAGKNLLYEHIIQKAAGFDFCPILDNERLKSKFNKFLTESLFVLWNEIKGDFKDNSLLADKMKALVTEPNIIIERKGIDADTKVITYFNSLIFSNHSLPFQVDPDDRRFFILETRRENFKVVVQRVLNIKMDKYLKLLDEEVDSFLDYVVTADFDLEMAKQAPMTQEKMAIAEATTPQINLFGNKLKTRSIDSITYLYEVFNDMFEPGEDLSFDVFEQNLKKFLQEVADGRVSIQSLKFAYKYFVNPAATKSKIEKDLKAEFGETKRNAKMRYKDLGKKIDIDIEALFSKENITQTKEFQETIEVMNKIVEQDQKEKTQKDQALSDYKEYKERVELTQKVKEISDPKENISNLLDELTEEEFDEIVNNIYGTSSKTFGDLLKEQQYA